MKSLSPLMFIAKVDPNYNFDEETEDKSRRKYGYEFCKEPLCNGLLVSKTMLEERTNIKQVGSKFQLYPKGNNTYFYSNIRRYLSLKKNLHYITFADPGTWSYAHKLELPDFLYDTDSVFNYYNSLRFDLCGSVDWPIIDKIRINNNGKIHFRDLSIKEKEHRRRLTTELAKSFMKKCSRTKRVNFVPFGTVQGYSVNTYISSLRKILKLGYKYVAIGGLPSYSEKKVLELLIDIRKCIRKYGDGNIGLHLYGRFPSPNAVLPFAKAGVTSFDNNYSYIMAAKTQCNVWNPEFLFDEDIKVPNFPCYGIKIPSIRGKAIVSFKKKSEKNLVDIIIKSANACYSSFVDFNRSQTPRNTKKFMISYKKMYLCFQKYKVSNLSQTKLDSIFFAAENTLLHKTWKRCGCTACKKSKSHISLLRGGTRIYYTFFHNTYTQFARYLKELKKPRVRKYTSRYDWADVYDVRDKNIKYCKRGRIA